MTKTRKDTDMQNQKYIYAAVFLTPYKTGEFIRFMTGFPYNHAAISLLPEMKYFYSFSRHYEKAPFFGGFTKESILRYKRKGKTAKMKIFALPVSDEQFSDAEKEIALFEKNKGEFVYNMISAAFFPLGIKIHIKNAYTCVEFVLEMLKKHTDIKEIQGMDFCNIREFCAVLEPFTVYEGSAERFFEGASWEGDTFPKRMGAGFYIKNTFLNNAKLLKRFILKQK